MIGQTNNQLLQQTEQQIVSKLKPQTRQAFAMASHAAAQLFYSPAVQQKIMAKLASTTDPIDNAALGAANLTGVLIKQSGGRMPTQIAVPVATVLLCEILDFLEKAGRVQVTPQALARATQLLGNYVLRMLGLKQDQVHQVLAHGMAQAQNPRQGLQQTQAMAPAAPGSGGIVRGAMRGGQ
ncbi:MAG TPA: hypothetical protein VF798_06145 [Burkholderiaceae bacterium]